VNFNNILIGSEDPQRLVAYYTKLLGPPTMQEDTYTGWMIGSGFMSIGPHDEVKGKNQHPGRLIWNIESPDVKGDFERMKAAGANVVKEPYSLRDPNAPADSPDYWIATLADPDDNYFQLTSPIGPTE